MGVVTRRPCGAQEAPFPGRRQLQHVHLLVQVRPDLQPLAVDETAAGVGDVESPWLAAADVMLDTTNATAPSTSFESVQRTSIVLPFV